MTGAEFAALLRRIRNRSTIDAPALAALGRVCAKPTSGGRRIPTAPVAPRVRSGPPAAANPPDEVSR